jgi:hypothetical protein
MTNSRIKAQGFFATLTNLGDQEWEAKVSGKDVIYQSELGTVRLCPDSYEKGLKTALGKPTTLNHTDTINGRITSGHVDGDGDPVLKWKVDEQTEKMMAMEGWDGGVSLAFFPNKLREDPEGIADYIAVDWEIDALGIGDGSEKPACPTGQCNPQQVKGMTSESEALMGGGATAEEIKAKQAEVAAAKAKADAEAAEAKAKEDAAKAEEQLKMLTQNTTEDTMKVFESLMDSKLQPLAEENEALKKKLEEATASDEAGKKFREEIVAQKTAAIIAELPEDTGIDYQSKTLDELLVLKQLADKVKGDTLPPPTGDPVEIPDPKSGAGAVSPEGWTDDEVREYNQQVKDRYRVKPKK